MDSDVDVNEELMELRIDESNIYENNANSETHQNKELFSEQVGDQTDITVRSNVSEARSKECRSAGSNQNGNKLFISGHCSETFDTIKYRQEQHENPKFDVSETKSTSKQFQDKLAVTSDRLLFNTLGSLKTRKRISTGRRDTDGDAGDDDCKVEEAEKIVSRHKVTTDVTDGILPIQNNFLENSKFSSSLCVNKNLPKDMHVTETDMKPTHAHTSKMKNDLQIIQNARKRLQEKACKTENELNNFIDCFIEAVQKHRKILLSQVKEIVKLKDNELKREENELKCSLHEMEGISLTNEDYKKQRLNNENAVSADFAADRFIYSETDLKYSSPRINRCLIFVPEVPSSVIGGFQMYGTVIGENVAPAKCILNASETAVVGKKSCVSLLVNNSQGVPIKQTVLIQSRLQRTKSKCYCRPVRIENKTNGEYLLWFTPNHRGPHQLSVNVNGVPVRGSPSQLIVRGKQRGNVELWNRGAKRDFEHSYGCFINESGLLDKEERDGVKRRLSSYEYPTNTSTCAFNNLKANYRQVTV